MSDTKHDDGGFAFPWTLVSEGTTNEWCAGMTLLDWFAGQMALASFTDCWSNEALARRAYDQAEALVAEKRRRERGANDEG
jgi:hypothetical protein